MPVPRLTIALLVMCLPVAFAAPAAAWSNKEHIQLTRIAAARLVADPTTPAEMKKWLQAATPGMMDMEGERRCFLDQRIGLFPRGVAGLPFCAVMPDMLVLSEPRGDGAKKVQPFGVSERLLHYIDL